jgi:putative membrane protein
MSRNVRVPFAAALALAVVAACGGLRPSPGPPLTDPSGAEAAAGAGRVASTGAPLTDANIAAIVVAANNADILYADLALAKSHDREVRAFATMVKKDHESVNEAAAALVARARITPVDHAISFDLRDDAETTRLEFRDLEGAAFDSAYAENEVAYHRRLLGALDGTLIPAARNAELRALLAQVRPAVAAHLQHAQRLAERTSRP